VNIDDTEAGLPAVTGLIAHLVEHGMVVTRDFRGGMGGVEILLHEPGVAGSEGPSAYVQVLGERGQWSLGVKFHGMREYRSPIEWIALIFGGRPKLASFDTQAGFLKADLELARHVYVQHPEAEQALARLGVELMKTEYPTLSKLFDGHSSLD
jgi:hypothetical protein